MEKLTILVTGGAGFIASHIVDAYIEAGHRVIVLDNLSTGKKENINPAATFYEVDIRDAEKVNEIIAKEKPDIINHHAAIAAVTASVNDPTVTHTTNVDGTRNLLEAAVANKVKKFIFASTGGAMYNGFTGVPFTEESPATPLSPYGASKLAGEELIKKYCKNCDTLFTIFRYANVFGPRQNPHGEAGIVAIFSKLLAEKKQPTLFNKDATRDYVYVEDIVDANVRALTTAHNDIFNIGTGVRTRNEEIFQHLAKLHGYTGEPKYAPGRPGEIEHTALDASKAHKVFKWKPLVRFVEGLKRIYDWKN